MFRSLDWADGLSPLIDRCDSDDEIWQLMHSLTLPCQRSLLPVISYWFDVRNDKVFFFFAFR